MDKIETFLYEFSSNQHRMKKILILTLAILILLSGCTVDKVGRATSSVFGTTALGGGVTVVPFSNHYQVRGILSSSAQTVRPGETITLTLNINDIPNDAQIPPATFNTEFGTISVPNPQPISGATAFFYVLSFPNILNQDQFIIESNIENNININLPTGEKYSYITSLLADAEDNRDQVTGSLTIPLDQEAGPLEIGVFTYYFSFLTINPRQAIPMFFIADITVLPDTPTTTVTSAASCSGQSCLTGLYAADNSHTTACGTTSTNLCVTVSPTACALDCSSDCSAANAATVLNRFSSSNAHISDATDTVYTDPVCCSLSTGCSFTLDTCTIKDSCATDEMELAGAYQDSNSHLSAQDTDKSICCSLKSQPQLTLVEVKQIAGGHIITYNKNFPGDSS